MLEINSSSYAAIKYGTLVLILIISTSSFLILRAHLVYEEVWKREKIIRSASIFLICGGAMLLIPAVTFEFVDRNHTIVTDRYVVADFKRPTILWQKQFNKMLSEPGAYLIDYGKVRHGHIQMATHPITDNPKVRSLRYIINVRLDNSAGATLKFHQTFPIGNKGMDRKYTWFIPHEKVSTPYEPISKAISTESRRLLYEFSEKNSRELATLYNPLDPGQQAKFREMLHAFMTEPLGRRGLYIHSSRFAIDD